MAGTNASQVHKSRWGFHPCNWDTFWKLKCIHKWYWQTVRDFANWKRWQRKLPKNRVIRRSVRDAAGRRIGYEVIGTRPEPAYCPAFLQHGNVTDKGFLQDYRNARMPKSDAKEVLPLSHSVDEIDKMFSRVRSWLEVNGRTL